LGRPHDEHQIQQVQDVFEQEDRFGGVERHTCLSATGFDLLDDPVQVRAGLLMDGDHIRASLDERFDVLLRGGDHQMGLKRQAGTAPHGLDNHGSHGDVRHKMAIHDIDLDALRARGLDGSHLLAQAREVRR